MRIVQLANYYSPISGGLRTVVDTLGRGYAALGHDRVLVVPGARAARRRTETGLVITVPGVPVGGGYRVVARSSAVLRLLDSLAVRRMSVEVSDKTTPLTDRLAPAAVQCRVADTDADRVAEDGDGPYRGRCSNRVNQHTSTILRGGAQPMMAR